MQLKDLPKPIKAIGIASGYYFSYSRVREHSKVHQRSNWSCSPLWWVAQWLLWNPLEEHSLDSLIKHCFDSPSCWRQTASFTVDSDFEYDLPIAEGPQAQCCFAAGAESGWLCQDHLCWLGFAALASGGRWACCQACCGSWAQLVVRATEEPPWEAQIVAARGLLVGCRGAILVNCWSRPRTTVAECWCLPLEAEVAVVAAALVARLALEAGSGGCRQRWASWGLRPTLKVADSYLLILIGIDFEWSICFNWTFIAKFISKPLSQ